jgi:hypothetical protein
MSICSPVGRVPVPLPDKGAMPHCCKSAFCASTLFPVACHKPGAVARSYGVGPAGAAGGAVLFAIVPGSVCMPPVTPVF